MELSGDWDGVAQRDARRRASGSRPRRRRRDHHVEHRPQGLSTRSPPTVGVPMLHIADATADAAGRRRPHARRFARHPLHDDRAARPQPPRSARDHARRRSSRPGSHEVDRIIFEELAAGRVVRDSQRKLKTLITELAEAEGPGGRPRLHRAGAGRRRPRQRPSGLRHDRDPRPRLRRLDARRRGSRRSAPRA